MQDARMQTWTLVELFEIGFERIVGTQEAREWATLLEMQWRPQTLQAYTREAILCKATRSTMEGFA